MKKERIYCYQPEFDSNGKIKGHEKAIFYSFCVYHKKKNLLADYPDATPIAYKKGDIEEPTFLD